MVVAVVVVVVAETVCVTVAVAVHVQQRIVVSVREYLTKDTLVFSAEFPDGLTLARIPMKSTDPPACSLAGLVQLPRTRFACTVLNLWLACLAGLAGLGVVSSSPGGV
jgi:hypothetical protein